MTRKKVITRIKTAENSSTDQKQIKTAADLSPEDLDLLCRFFIILREWDMEEHKNDK